MLCVVIVGDVCVSYVALDECDLILRSPLL